MMILFWFVFISGLAVFLGVGFELVFGGVSKALREQQELKKTPKSARELEVEFEEVLFNE